MSISTTARRLGIGAIAHHGFRRPTNWLRELWLDGGPLQRRRTEAGRNQMEAAAAQLPLLTTPPAGTSPITLHLLTGRRFWFQTAFCLWSLARHAKRPLVPVIYDDGSLASRERDALLRLFPSTHFVTKAETLARLNEVLPASNFPFLRERWLNYPNIRKLIDVHAGSTGWKLVLDSDLLFFRRPDFLINWLDQPTCPLHAVDCETSYGYSRELMDRLAGAPTADLVNVGLTGLDSGEIDWEKLEQWCETLSERERPSYYLEQALVAMLLAGRVCAVAPASDYITKPVQPEASTCRAVMHHYVANSKRWYFQHNWHTAISR